MKIISKSNLVYHYVYSLAIYIYSTRNIPLQSKATLFLVHAGDRDEDQDMPGDGVCSRRAAV
jgi:hypothetical protein